MRGQIHILLGALVLLPLLACATGGQLPAASHARWACPSPTPRLWGPSGPVKAYVERPNPTTGIPETIALHYAEWEQEYPTPGLASFPSPTPYGYVGDTFVLGQRVEVGPGLHVRIDAGAGQPAALPGAPQQLYRLQLSWYNATGAPLPVAYAQQVALTAIVEPDGSQRSDGWQTTSVARDQAHLSPLPTAIPPGESTVVVPILAPPGRAKTVSLTLPVGSWSDRDTTPSPISTTPTPNVELRLAQTGVLTVQWVDARFRYFDAPACSDPGALTDWGSGPQTVPTYAAAPGTGRLVQLALAQVGKRYVWGATGPEQFDCSGLVVWLYGQIGIRGLPRTTFTQFPALRPVERGQLAPGDLVYFAIQTPGTVDHVGMLVGDIDGDGTLDMVHAANPSLGVRLERNVFGSAYFTRRMAGFRTLR